MAEYNVDVTALEKVVFDDPANNLANEEMKVAFFDDAKQCWRKPYRITLDPNCSLASVKFHTIIKKDLGIEDITEWKYNGGNYNKYITLNSGESSVLHYGDGVVYEGATLKDGWSHVATTFNGVIDDELESVDFDVIISAVSELQTCTLSYPAMPDGVLHYYIDRVKNNKYEPSILKGRLVYSPTEAGTIEVYYGDELEISVIGDNGYESPTATLSMTEVTGDVIATVEAGAYIQSKAFSTCSWAEISEISESGRANTEFSVGDEKTITTTDGEEITFVILGFDHDDKADGTGKAGMTIGMKHLLNAAYTMYGGYVSTTETKNWDTSTFRTTTAPQLLGYLPSDLQEVIKPVTKYYTDTDSTIDSLWLLTPTEIGGDSMTHYYYTPVGVQYEYYKTVVDGSIADNRIKKRNNGIGDAIYYWTRSFRKGNMNAGEAFAFTKKGELTCTGPGNQYGISYAFCI